MTAHVEVSAFRRAAAATVVAEVAFGTADGGVAAAAVTPLADGDDVVLALPYADRGLADALASADEVALALTDERLTLAGWEPLAALGRMVVEADADGARFRGGLVDDELRKYPPARLLADSLMDRREHWWYMPRLVCRLRDVRHVHPLAARSGPAQGVLAWADAAGLRVDAVEVDGLAGGDLRVRSLAGAVLAGAADPACLLRHDFSIPDLERRSGLVEHGRLEGDVLRVTGREGELALPAVPGLVTRLRRQRAFARACRRELARAAREPPPG
jgi:hypothetical protein